VAASFELKSNAVGKFVFNLKAANGQVILTSQAYASKPSAQGGIESVRKNSADDLRFERKTSSGGQPYFVLTATNGQIVGQSEMYASAAAMENGVASVKKNAPEAAVVDLTA
jgi:uncharacterized protein YegP (UPF0339 family)